MVTIASVLYLISCIKQIKSPIRKKIKKFLEKNNILYETQKRFKELPRLSFDFYVPDVNLLIEYQGEQHYLDVAFFNKKYHSMDITKKHDQMKKEHCQKNNIRLIEIPYYDFDKLNEQYILDKIK